MASSAYSQQIQKLREIFGSLEALSSLVDKLNSMAEDTWFIDPKGLELNEALNYISRNAASVLEKYQFVVKETNYLLDSIEIEYQDITAIKELTARILVSGEFLGFRIDKYRSVVEDNMWVIGLNIIIQVGTVVKEVVKLAASGLKFAVTGIIEGTKSTFRLPGSW